MINDDWHMNYRRTALDSFGDSQSPTIHRPRAITVTLPDVRPVSREPLSAWISRVIAVLRAWNRNARSRRELLQLNDRELRDIGLTRVEASYEANRPFWDFRRGPTL